MSGLPLVLRGEAIEALVVGGGAVAERKVRALAQAGARVRLVAPAITSGLHALVQRSARVIWLERAYVVGDLGDAAVIIAATNDRAVNAQVAADAREARRLVNVVDDPAAGNFVTAAVHRAGDVLIAVTTGGVPGAAARIRDAIASRVDGRYAAAVSLLREIRGRALERRDPDHWRRASEALLDARFCERVERGAFAEEAAPWR